MPLCPSWIKIRNNPDDYACMIKRLIHAFLIPFTFFIHKLIQTKDIWYFQKIAPGKGLEPLALRLKV